MKIKKRTGNEEEFVANKLHTSMVNAGASETIAQNVSHEIKPHPGITTDEIRKTVVSKLEKSEPEVARKFNEYRK